MSKWYVRCGAETWLNSAKALERMKHLRVWTLSKHPEEIGWENDSCCDGYGLSWDEATELANAANGDKPWSAD
jgi:hypothetical protein